MSRKLPKGWEYRELGDLVRIVSGGTPARSNAEYWGGDMPWITAKDLKEFDLRDSQERLTESGAKQATVAPENTVLVLVRGMGLFKDIPIGITSRPMAFNQDVKALYPNEEIVPRYLGYALQALRHYLMGNVDQAGHGTGRLSTTVLEELPLPIPKKLEEQRRVVCVLDAMDRQIDLAGKISHNAKKKAQDSIRMVIAGKAADLVELDQVVSRVRRKPACNKAVPLTISAESGLVPQSNFFGKRVASDYIDTYTLIRRGEFAYNKSYSNGYPYGAIKRLEQIEEGVLSSLYLCFGVKDSQKLSGEYLAALSESGYFNRQIHMIAHEGARNHGLLNVSAEDFFSMMIPLPSLSEQQRISKIVMVFEKNVEQSLVRVEMLRRQKRGLMQKLLTGQWRLTRDLPDVEAADV